MSEAVHICMAPADEVRHSPGTGSARDVYRLESRLNRLEKRAEAARGETMNLAWLHWFDEWSKCWEAYRTAKRMRGEPDPAECL